MNPLDKIHESWSDVRKMIDDDPLVKQLNSTILPTTKFFPSAENIFNVFSMPKEEVRVVILGQDPYPQDKQAIGYAFAVAEDIRMPKSLQIIAKEIEDEDAGFPDSEVPNWRTLEHWRDQGVFLLNTALTVQKGKAGSHIKYWKSFTENLVKYISQTVKPIWVLWGKSAQEYEQFIAEDNPILKAPHPAAEAYSGGKAGFYGCNHFNEINNLLIKNDQTTIVW